MTLWELNTKQQALIISVKSELAENVKERLSGMGIQVGRDIQCVRKGPLGGPIVMQLGGSVFAIEKNLAAQIEVEARN